MNPLKKISLNITKALVAGYTPERIAQSCAMGLYIAFSPFPGLHSVMIILSQILFRLHLPTVFIIASLNNPWTMVPLYTFDYAFGHWIVHSLLGISPTLTISAEIVRPYAAWLADALAKFIGSGKLCLWSFLVGGNVAGIVAALCCYPLVKKLLKHKKSNAEPS